MPSSPLAINKGRRNLTLVAICLVHACLMGSITLTGALGAQLMMDYNLTLQEFVSMTMISYLTGAIFGIPLGIFGDKTQVDKAILAGIVIATVGAAIRPFVGDYAMMYLSNFIIGFGLAGLNANSVKFLNPWWDQKITVGMGFYVSCASVGTALSMLVPQFAGGVQESYFVALGAMVFACIIWALFGKMPEGYVSPASSISFADYKEVAKVPTVWLSSLAMGFAMAGGVCVVITASTSMALGKGIDPDFANQLVSMNTLLSVVAGCLVPIVVDRINNFRVSVSVFAVLTGLMLIFFWFSEDVTAMAAFFVVQAIFPGGVVPTIKSSIGMIKKVVARPQTLGAAGGLQAAVQNLGAFLIPSFVIAPIAGEDYGLYWILVCVSWFIAGLLVLCMKKEDLIETGKNAKSIGEQTSGI